MILREKLSFAIKFSMSFVWTQKKKITDSLKRSEIWLSNWWTSFPGTVWQHTLPELQNMKWEKGKLFKKKPQKQRLRHVTSVSAEESLILKDHNMTAPVLHWMTVWSWGTSRKWSWSSVWGQLSHMAFSYVKYEKIIQRLMPAHWETIMRVNSQCLTDMVEFHKFQCYGYLPYWVPQATPGC